MIRRITDSTDWKSMKNINWTPGPYSGLPLIQLLFYFNRWRPAVNKLEREVGEVVSLQIQAFPYFQLREKFKCKEHISISETQLKTSPWNQKIWAKLLPLSHSYLEPWTRQWSSNCPPSFCVTQGSPSVGGNTSFLSSPHLCFIIVIYFPWWSIDGLENFHADRTTNYMFWLVSWWWYSHDNLRFKTIS